VVAAELLGPFWLTGGVVYIAFVLLSMCWPQRRVVLAGAAVGSVVVGSHLLSDLARQQPWMIIAHCSLWVVALWITAVLTLRRGKAEGQAARFFDRSLDLLVLFSIDGFMKRVNPAFEQALGYTSRELLARPYLELVHPDDRDTVAAEVASLSAGTPTVGFECRLRHKDGSDRLISWTCSRLPAESLVYADGRDISERKRAEEALQKSERFVARIVQATPALVMVFDLLEAKYVYANHPAAQFFGLRPDEFESTGIRFFEERVHQDDIPKIAQGPERLASVRDNEVIESEHRMKRADGQWRWLHIRDVVFARTDNGAPRQMLCVAVDTTERHLADQALKESEVQQRRGEVELRALTTRLISVQEEERRRLARELHDNLGQKVSSIAIETAALAKQSSVALDRVREHLATLPEALGDLAEEIRVISHQLHPAILDNVGLVAALETECEVFSRRERISMRLRSENIPPSLPDDVSLCLYRIAQECLSNIARHAHARQGSVTLTGVEDSILLAIADSGVGFDPSEAGSKGGLGIVSMGERVRLVGGKISVTSRPGQGTEIEVEVPLAGEVS